MNVNFIPAYHNNHHSKIEHLNDHSIDILHSNPLKIQFIESISLVSSVRLSLSVLHFLGFPLSNFLKEENSTTIVPVPEFKS
jgi:hypothetical protein